MSATPPFGPAYGEQPEDGRRSGSGQWRPSAGRPQGGQGEPQGEQPGRNQGEPYAPGRGRPDQGGYGGQPGGRPMPQAGRPSPESRGGVPRAGGPSAGPGRGPQPGPYQSPQQHTSPQSPAVPPRSAQTGPLPGSPPRADRRAAPQDRGQTPPPQAPDGPPTPLADQPFEEAAFADDRSRDDWSGDAETSAIGRLGYMPKEPRRRSDFQKVRSRARKSSPLPKIIAGVVVLALIGGGVWWWMNRPAEEEAGQAAAEGLTYQGTETPCALADATALEALVGGAEPVEAAEAEQKNSGWVQSCSLTYGEPEQSTALLEFEATAFETDARASVNFELDTRELGEMGEAWTLVDPAPAIGDQNAAVARVVTDGTSNYRLHVQDDNVYLVVRLSVAKDAALDEQGLTDLATELATRYLENWRAES